MIPGTPTSAILWHFSGSWHFMEVASQFQSPKVFQGIPGVIFGRQVKVDNKEKREQMLKEIRGLVLAGH